MEKHFFYNATPEPGNFGDLIRQARIDKKLSYEDVAKKIQVNAEEVEKLEKMEIIPNDEILRKLSGNLGITYRRLRIGAGYNMMGSYPDYYLPDGTAIDIEEILSKIYYKYPASLSRLYELIEVLLEE
mgnify:FL=1